MASIDLSGVTRANPYDKNPAEAGFSMCGQCSLFDSGGSICGDALPASRRHSLLPKPEGQPRRRSVQAPLCTHLFKLAWSVSQFPPPLQARAGKATMIAKAAAAKVLSAMY